MNSKRIGNIGEAKVLAKFVELGIPVYLPFGDTEKIDLIADFNGKLNRIQVKTSLKAEEGVIKFSLVSSTMHRKNGVKHFYNKDEIDFFACYNIERDKVFLIDIENFHQGTIQIRYEKSQNGQNKNIKYEEDFLLENVLMPLENGNFEIKPNFIKQRIQCQGNGIDEIFDDLQEASDWVVINNLSVSNNQLGIKANIGRVLNDVRGSYLKMQWKYIPR